MARDKLITIRIEGEKREAFNNLAKSQNTDTASLLYDFISGCLDGTIDIGIVTGKGNRLDKLDNRIDSDRLDKLEATTQEIDNRLDTIAKKLTDWIEAFDDRLNDCDQGLTNRMISLEHRLNTLAIQLDSQQIDRIDTDSQKENPDMEPLLKREREASIATSPLPPIEETSPLPPLAQPAIGTVTPEVSPSPPGTDKEAIEDSEKKIVDSLDTSIASPIGIDETVSTDSTVEPDTDAIETDDREWLTLQQIADKKIKGLPGTHQGLRPYAENWEWRENPTKKGKQYKIPREYLTPISPNPSLT